MYTRGWLIRLCALRRRSVLNIKMLPNHYPYSNTHWTSPSEVNTHTVISNIPNNIGLLIVDSTYLGIMNPIKLYETL